MGIARPIDSIISHKVAFPTACSGHFTHPVTATFIIQTMKVGAYHRRNALGACPV